MVPRQPAAGQLLETLFTETIRLGPSVLYRVELERRPLAASALRSWPRLRQPEARLYSIIVLQWLVKLETDRLVLPENWTRVLTRTITPSRELTLGNGLDGTQCWTYSSMGIGLGLTAPLQIAGKPTRMGLLLRCTDLRTVRPMS